MTTRTDNHTGKRLICGEGLERASLGGRGTRDGHGRVLKSPYKLRPHVIRLVGCKIVVFEGSTLRNPPMRVQQDMARKGLRTSGLTVKSRVHHNNDGVAVDSRADAIAFNSISARRGIDAIVGTTALSLSANLNKWKRRLL